MTYTELLPHLIQNRQLAPIPMNPIQSPYPKWYDSNARCDYYAEGAGHSIENCLALKRNVQSLINDGWLSFKKVGEKPDVNNNPLPNHENPKVNIVDCFVSKVQKWRRNSLCMSTWFRAQYLGCCRYTYIFKRISRVMIKLLFVKFLLFYSGSTQGHNVLFALQYECTVLFVI